MSVQDYHLNNTINTYSVEASFTRLRTFPFEKVVNMMTDEMRKYLRNQLGFLYYPYTLPQYNAITRLRYGYPTARKDVELMNRINELTKTIGEHTDSHRNCKLGKCKLSDYADELVDLIYEIDANYLWIISKKVNAVLKTLSYSLNETNRVKTASSYLDRFEQSYQHEIRPFEEQLVDDITQLTILSFIHPEIVIALESAQQILITYYDSSKVYSKLFIDNIDYKINRYLLKAYEELGKDHIEEVRNRDTTIIPTYMEDKEEEVLVSEKYAELRRLLQQYQTTGKGLQALLELTNEMTSLPYHLVEDLPGFMKTVEIVKTINPFAGLK